MTAPVPAPHEPDPDQRKVIASRDRSIRVLAPAGSGKTETLGRRVAERIADGVPPGRILILTFDNQARNSFQQTLRRLGVTTAVEIRTLNAFGLRLLTQHFPDEPSRSGKHFYGPSEPLLVELVEMSDQGSLVDMFGTLKSHLFDPRKLDARKLGQWIRRHYRQLVPEKYLTAYPEEAHAADFGKQLRREFVRYEEFLQARHMIDFDDQKLRTLALLETHPDVAERVRGRYDEIIVDEFQDINPLDLELIKLVARDATLVITGDDDQAIYGFRWASADFLIRPGTAFGRDFTSFELRTNYRCPRTILQRSRQLIERNRNRVAKHPKSGVSAAGAIDLLPSGDRLGGAASIVGLIRDAVKDNALTWGDIAVLTRRNQHLDEIQVQLIVHGIPYLVRSDRDLVQTWSQTLGLLDLSTALRTRPGVPVTDYRAAISAFTWFPGAVKRDALPRFEGLTLPEVLLSIQPHVSERSLRQFEQAIDVLRKGRTVQDELDAIETRFLGYRAKPDKGTPGAASDQSEAPLALLRTILGRRSGTRAHDIERLRGFIARSAESNAGGGPRVELATYHGAKGRQWKLVILPWVSGTAVPDPLTRQEFGELEAERRLFYVAMTRAADRLVIGHPAEDSKEWTSRFVHEAGIIPWPDAAPAAANGKTATAAPAPGTKPRQRALR